MLQLSPPSRLAASRLSTWAHTRLRSRSLADCSWPSPALCQSSPPLSWLTAGAGCSCSGVSVVVLSRSSSCCGSPAPPSLLHNASALFASVGGSGHRWGRSSAKAPSRAGVSRLRSSKPPKACKRPGSCAGASFQGRGNSQSSGSSWGLCSCLARRLSQSARLSPDRNTLSSSACSKLMSGTSQGHPSTRAKGSESPSRRAMPP